MQADPRDLYELIVMIRGAFHDLKAASDSLHTGRNVTTAMRAVLEYLSAHDGETVPQIAKAKNVSRQHIQLLADALATKDLLEFVPNPGHARSPLLTLTGKGRATFAEMHEIEKQLMADSAAGFDAADLSTAVRVISALRERMRSVGPASENDSPAEGPG